MPFPEEGGTIDILQLKSRAYYYRKARYTFGSTPLVTKGTSKETRLSTSPAIV